MDSLSLIKILDILRRDDCEMSLSLCEDVGSNTLPPGSVSDAAAGRMITDDDVSSNEPGTQLSHAEIIRGNSI